MPLRKLNSSEIELLKIIYFNKVDYSKIRITNKHIFSYILKKYSGITFGNKIVFSKRAYRDDFSKKIADSALLVHEVCHVWQHQTTDYWWAKAIPEHLKFGKDVYKYKLENDKQFGTYRYEQQAEIMADYFRSIANSDNELSEKLKNIVLI